MVDMLPLIKVVPEFNYSLDPSTGVIGAAVGRELLILSMDEINEQIAALEATADDLVNSLDPSTVPEGSYPGREGVYLTAGKLTNIVYGFILGMILLCALIFL